jgi:glycosyltransferase involved in cell wall biosynthesis
MRIETRVFDDDHGPLTARTVRVLARIGLEATPIADPDIRSHLRSTPRPVWLVRAGAWPRTGPAAVLSERPIVAIGATSSSLAWRNILAETGGDLDRALSLPRVDSVLVVPPGTFDSARNEAAGARIVRAPSLDVDYHAKLRVILALTTLHRGGAERIVIELARHLRAMGHHAVVATFERPCRSTFEGEEPWTLHALPRDLRGAHLASLSEEHGFDVVHAHLLDAPTTKTLDEGAVPLIVTMHNAREGWPRGVPSADLRALLIACSSGVDADLRAEGHQRTRTIWNGIRPGGETVRKPREGLALLTVANHRPQKRLERLPAVVAALRDRGIDAQLTIVGEPLAGEDVAARVRAQAERLDVPVRLEPSTENVSHHYANADVYVSASAHEGLSLAHLEAIDAGLPVVTTAVHGSSELASHANVRVVPIDAPPSAFADAIASSLHAKPVPLAPDFHASTMATRHVALYRRVVRPRATGPRVLAGTGQDGLVLVTNHFGTGGAQTSARRLLLGLQGEGIRVSAVVIEEQRSFPTPGRAALEAAGIAVHVAPRTLESAAAAVVKHIDAFDPRAVVFWNATPEIKVLVADRMLDVPVWDVSPGEMYYASFERCFARPRAGLPYRSLADYGKLLAGVVVKYEDERERAASLGAPVTVVPNGVPVSSYRPPRSRHGVVAGTLARLCPDKKLEQLVEAVRSMPPRPGFELRIAGAPDRGSEAWAEALIASARGLPIRFVGERASETFLADLDLFVMVSEPAGCPNASLEAMAAALPIVATDAGGAREQVVHEHTGLVVPRGDAQALGRTIFALAEDAGKRVAYGAAGHARAASRFDVRRMTQDYRTLFGLGEPRLRLDLDRGSEVDTAAGPAERRGALGATAPCLRLA